MNKLTFSDKYLIPWLTLLSGLAISAIAVWYSIAGLVAIFAASATAIIAMGVVLEVGKLVTAVWLHRNWNHTVRWLKSYLAFAVFFLMVITSMGIFGFLSKAHIEQTSMSDEQTAQIEVIDEKITRGIAKIDRWNQEMERLLKGSGNSSTALVAGDQDALSDIRALIKDEKEVVRKEAQDRIKVAQDRRDAGIKAAENSKQSDLKAAEIRLKDSWGGGDEYDKIVAGAKQAFNNLVSQAKDKENTESTEARKVQNTKLKAIDKKYKKELNVLNKRINSANKDGKLKSKQIDVRLKEIETNIVTEQSALDLVREDKMVYEKEFRKLEAEVGPVKYIAEFVYGQQADKEMLEKAVRWVIILIIFVFDPLAVLMLIASQYSFRYARGDPNAETNGKTRIIERTIEVDADVDGDTPKDVRKLEKKVNSKLEKK